MALAGPQLVTRRSARTSRRRSSAARASTAGSRAWATSRWPTTRSASRHQASTCRTSPRTASRRRRALAVTDPVDRLEEALLDVLPESNRKPYDMYDVIQLIVDDGDVARPQAQVGAHDHHLPGAHGRSPGRDRRVAAAPPRRHPRQRLRRQGRAVREPVRRLRDPARVPRRRAGVHGRHEGRAGGDHPPRREDAARGRVRHGAQDHGRAAQGVRRRLLRDERPGLRARPDRRVAVGRDLGDGRRGRGQDRVPQAGRGAEDGRQKAR